MVATDHASAELKGMALLRESHGVIPCGDPSHAVHGAQHGEAFDDEV